MVDVNRSGEFFQSHADEIKELAVRVRKPGSRMFGYRFINEALLEANPERFIVIDDETEVEIAAKLIEALDDLSRNDTRLVCVIGELDSWLPLTEAPAIKPLIPQD
jgi:hypothetical protein